MQEKRVKSTDKSKAVFSTPKAAFFSDSKGKTEGAFNPLSRKGFTPQRGIPVMSNGLIYNDDRMGNGAGTQVPVDPPERMTALSFRSRFPFGPSSVTGSSRRHSGLAGQNLSPWGAGAPRFCPSHSGLRSLLAGRP